MGDTDGSSSAAHGAQLKNIKSKRKPKSFFARIAGWLSFGDLQNEPDITQNFESINADTNSEVGNLLRVSIQDVSIPKAEIVAVNDTISKEDLFDTFKNTALTRLPVYEGTLDSPLGFDHEEEKNASKMEKIEVQVLAKLGINNPYL